MEYVKDLIIPVLIAVIGSGAFSGVISAIIARKGKGDPVRIGLRMLLRDRLESLIVASIKEGCISLSKRRQIREMWVAYENLGGNGELKSLMDDLDGLPLK